MPYELKYIKTAIEGLSLKPRAEGETAFPALATVLEAVRAVVRSTSPTEEQERQQKLDAYIAKAKAEGYEAPGPEMQARIDALNAKFDLKAKPKEVSTMLTCPRCSHEHSVAGNIRQWSLDELKAHIALLESPEYAALKEAV